MAWAPSRLVIACACHEKFAITHCTGVPVRISCNIFFRCRVVVRDKASQAGFSFLTSIRSLLTYSWFRMLIYVHCSNDYQLIDFFFVQCLTDEVKAIRRYHYSNVPDETARSRLLVSLRLLLGFLFVEEPILSSFPQENRVARFRERHAPLHICVDNRFAGSMNWMSSTNSLRPGQRESSYWKTPVPWNQPMGPVGYCPVFPPPLESMSAIDL